MLNGNTRIFYLICFIQNELSFFILIFIARKDYVSFGKEF
jgi:hypothetical protein